MSVKIRLQRKGRKKRPFYHIVVADSRSPRDGRYIDRLGLYNPMTKPATIELDREKAYDWLEKGAQPTDTARAILRFKGVYYKRHLMRGVKKGALTVEEANAKYEAWVKEKEDKIAERFAQTAKEKADFHAKLSGVAPVIAAPTPAAEEGEERVKQEEPKTLAEEIAAKSEAEDAAALGVETAAEEATEAVEEAAETVEEAVSEATETVEEVKEEVAEAAEEATEEVADAKASEEE